MKTLVLIACCLVAARSCDRGSEEALVGALGGARGLNRLAVCPGRAPACPGGAPACPGRAPACPGGAPACPGRAPACPGGAPACPGRAPACPGGVPVCPTRAPACPAALWRRRWAVARASCLAAHSLPAVRVLRDIPLPALCDTALSGTGTARAEARRVWARREHPHWAARWPGFDVALLLLDRPYDLLDPPANASAVKEHLAKFEVWMEWVYAEERRLRRAAEGRRREARPLLLSSPALALVCTVLAPAAALLAAFLVVTFGTGAPVKVPYANVADEHTIRTPWQTPYYHVPNVKCYTAYGEV